MKFSAIILLAATAVLLVGCSAKPIQLNEHVAIYQHGTAQSRYLDALNKAIVHCQKYNKVATMSSQTCPGQCISQFRCE
ncbi:hypothetical protein [Pseudomonas sp. EA_35y_Pfl2_R111]|uniref:hypothetical protein n=1 Tax=Pseudomonas sp. EA_35y_Pfl2_R111 TaxID=3088689 RepID=UPI0030DA6BA3